MKKTKFLWFLILLLAISLAGCKNSMADYVAKSDENPFIADSGYVKPEIKLDGVMDEAVWEPLQAFRFGDEVKADVKVWDDFVAPAEALAAKKAEKDGLKDVTDREIAELLVSWHYQEVVLPSITEPEVDFDPMDETQVDLTGLPHAPVSTEPTEEAA